MKALYKASVLLLLLFATSYYCGAQRVPSNSEDRAAPKRQAPEVWSLRVSVPESVTSVGDAKVTIGLKNVSERVLNVSAFTGDDCELYFDMEVRDAEGKSVQLTRYYENLRKGGLGSFEGSRIAKTLKAGQEQMATVNLSRLYNLSVGTYRVTVRTVTPYDESLHTSDVTMITVK